MATPVSGWISMRSAHERIRALFGREEGQSLVEFSLLTPLLLILFMGIAEAATAYDRQHALVGLSREAANIASRGAELDEVVQLVLSNGAQFDLEHLGGVVVSRIFIDDGSPEIIAQAASPGFEAASKLGAVGGTAVPLAGVGLVDGQSLHVVEVFTQYRSFTPLSAFVAGAVPEGLYSRSVF